MYINNKSDKFFLWLLLFLQLFLIILFMLFYNNNFRDYTLNNSEINVRFISAYNQSSNKFNKVSSDSKNEKNIRLSTIVTFSEKFTRLDNHNETAHYCYNDGTQAYHSMNNKHNLNKCNCHPEWHGVDCGQPEVIWRSFMTSKFPIILSPPRLIPHRIYYVINTNEYNLETLEIQIMEMYDLVELFVICNLSLVQPSAAAASSSSSSSSRTSKFSDNTRTGFLVKLFNLKRLIIINCNDHSDIISNLKTVLSNQLNLIDDIIIYSKSNEILNRQAINYFKWYDSWPQPVYFRLKYNVYGFFWQHSNKTKISSVLCQLNKIKLNYKSSLDTLLNSFSNLTSTISNSNELLIVGDLNYYGGWLCKYCNQPIDIIFNLELNKNLYIKFNKINNKNNVIDIEYIQNLISKGVDIDDEHQLNDQRLKLTKLQRYSDKYYWPEYVANNSWKFDNIVINFFSKWDENDDDDYF